MTSGPLVSNKFCPQRFQPSSMEIGKFWSSEKNPKSVFIILLNPFEDGYGPLFTLILILFTNAQSYNYICAVQLW